MRKTAIRGLAAYLVGGVLFALNTLPPTMWACPSPAAPHGHTVHSAATVPDRENCWRTRTLGDDAAVVAYGSVAWLPLIVAKGLNE